MLIETIEGCKELLREYRAADVPTYVSGPPGVGKSDAFKQLTKELKIGFKDIRLGTKLPEDFNGIPVPDLEKRMAIWLKAEFWPDPKRDGPAGIMLLDELTDTSKAVQSCAYQVVLDRCIGDLKLEPGWWPAAAGNRREDRAAAQALSTALANRFAHITVGADPEAWMVWANTNDIDPLITGYIRFRPTHLYSMEGADLRAFPTPRSWVQASKFVRKPPSIRFRLMAGLIGEGVATEFEAVYMKTLDLPDFDDVLKAPDKCPIPKQPGSKYALSSMLSRYTKRDNIGKVMTYVTRPEFGRDFEIITIMDATRRDTSLMDTKPYGQFTVRNKDLTL